MGAILEQPIDALTRPLEHLLQVYVGKAGNDSHDGTNPNRPKLTIAAAVTAAGTPADEANAVTVEVLDDGEYTENLTHVSYVNVYAPHATLKGTQTLADHMRLLARRLVNNGNTNILVKTSGSTGTYVEADEIKSDTSGGTAFGLTDLDAGGVHVRARYVEQNEGDGFDLQVWADQALTLDIDEWYAVGAVAGNVTMLNVGAFGGTGPRVVARIGYMHGGANTVAFNMNNSDSTIVADVEDLDVASVFDVTGNQNNHMRLRVGRMQGTVTVNNGADVRFTEAKRDDWSASSAPGTGDDSSDGYQVGSWWWDGTGRELYLARDVTPTAAAWDRFLNATTGGALGGDLDMQENDLLNANEIVGGTAIADELILRSHSAAMNDPDGDGFIRVQNPMQLEVPSLATGAGVLDGFIKVVRCESDISFAGQTVVLPIGYYWKPTIRFDQPQGLGTGSAFWDASLWTEDAAIVGSHTDFVQCGFNCDSMYVLGHSGTGTPPGIICGFNSEPRADAGLSGGSVTLPLMVGYSTNRPLNLRGFVLLQQLLRGAICTEYCHFRAHSDVPGGIILQGGSTITTEIGIDFQTLNTGGTCITLRSDAVGAYMDHAGDIRINSDVNGLVLGAGQDARLWYDGTNVRLDPRLVGSGHTIIDSGRLGLSEASPATALDIDKDAGGTDLGGVTLEELSTDIAAPAANKGAVFMKDNGSGKTQLCVRFNTGAVQVLATQP